MRAIRLLSAVVVAASAVVLAASPAVASVPFSDPAVQGFIGLCDTAGHPLTSGSTLDSPLAWTAVSSVAAPPGYEQGKATLYAFQPRKGVDPGFWSGKQMSGSSSFTNPKNPVVQLSGLDPPLYAFQGGFPLNWDGLLQLRIYYTAPDADGYRRTYPATVLKISGQRWSVVSGGTVGCNLGQGTSSEGPPKPPVTILPGSSVPGGSGASPSSSTTTATASPGSTSPGSSVSTSSTVQIATGATPGSTSGHHKSSATAWVVGVAVVAVGGAAAGGAIWWRRRSSAPV